MLMSIVVLVLGFFGTTSAAGSWGYGPTHEVYGPADWGHVSSDCNGLAQSPVNIDDADDDDDFNDLHVQFDNPDGLVEGNLINNGHFPSFYVNKSQGGASLDNPIDGEKYIFALFHFHFGCADNVGSEHTVDGISYPGELHLGFYNAKYGNIGTAATKTDGLTAIGVFFTKSSNGNPELVTFARNLNDIITEGATKVGVTVRLGDLVPGLSSGGLSYYTYKGSIASPGCYESVRWLVLKDPISANNEILNNFRALQATHGYSHGKMCNNYRPTLPLNGRKIYLHK